MPRNPNAARSKRHTRAIPRELLQSIETEREQIREDKEAAIKSKRRTLVLPLDGLNGYPLEIARQARMLGLKAVPLPTQIELVKPDLANEVLERRLKNEQNAITEANLARDYSPLEYLEPRETPEDIILRRIKNNMGEGERGLHYNGLDLRIDGLTRRTLRTDDTRKTLILARLIDLHYDPIVDRLVEAAHIALDVRKPVAEEQRSLTVPLVEIDAPYAQTQELYERMTSRMLPRIVLMKPIQIAEM